MEQALYRRDVAFVGEEKDDVVFRFDDGVVVGHEYGFAAHDSANSGPRRQVDGLNTATDDPGAAGIAVNDGFNGFGGPPAQAVDLDHIAPTDVGEQGADGGLGGGDGDVDGFGLNQVHIGGFVDQGHDLFCAQAFGEQERGCWPGRRW